LQRGSEAQGHDDQPDLLGGTCLPQEKKRGRKRYRPGARRGVSGPRKHRENPPPKREEEKKKATERAPPPPPTQKKKKHQNPNRGCTKKSWSQRRMRSTRSSAPKRITSQSATEPRLGGADRSQKRYRRIPGRSRISWKPTRRRGEQRTRGLRFAAPRHCGRCEILEAKHIVIATGSKRSACRCPCRADDTPRTTC